MSESEPSPKKRRISRACDQCRKRKSKCDGVQPICSICQHADRDCTYGEVAKRRGLQPGYVKSLEIVLGLIITRSPDTQKTVQNILRDQYNGLHLFTSESTEKLTQTWRASDLAKDLALLLSAYENTSDDDFHADCSILSPLVTTFDDQSAPSTQRSQLLDSINDLPEISISEPNNAWSTVLSNFHERRFPSYSNQLIDHYFNTVHYIFPVLERSQILRVIYSGKPVCHLSREDVGTGLSIWAVIAYDLVVRPDYLEVDDELTSDSIVEWIMSYLIQHLDENHNDVVDNYKIGIGHVQAVLVLVFLKLGKGNFQSASVFLAVATRMLNSISSPLTTSSSRHPHVVRSCIFVDNFISAIVGQQTCLSFVQQNSVQPIDENGLDEWDMWLGYTYDPGQSLASNVSRKPLRALSILNLSSGMLRLLSKAGLGTFPMPPPQARNCLNELRQWRSNLADEYKLLHSDSITPQLLNLHFSWTFVVLTLLMQREVNTSSMHLIVEEVAQVVCHLLGYGADMMRISGGSPLLYGFYTQIQRYLKSQHGQIPSHLVNDTDALLETCKLFWNRRNTPTNRPSVQDFPSFSPLSIPVAGISPRPGSAGPPSSTSLHHNALDIANPENMAGMTNPNHPLINLDISANQTSFTFDPISETLLPGMDDFDILFQELTSAAPSRRPDVEPDFAYNLGFVSADLDDEILTLLGPPL